MDNLADNPIAPVLNPRATQEPYENEDGYLIDGFPVNDNWPRMEQLVEQCNAHIAKNGGKTREPATREDFGLNPSDGVGLNLRRKRMGSTWDHSKHIMHEFGRFAGEVTYTDKDGAVHKRWAVLIKDLFGGVYWSAEYTSMKELHKVWELD